MYFIVLVVLAAFTGVQISAEEVERAPVPVRPCQCFNRTSPVCATNNVTYNNDCLLKCAKRLDNSIHRACKGNCPCQCTCPAQTARPVCGTDGNTYANICLLKCAQKYNNRKLRVACRKECPCV